MHGRHSNRLPGSESGSAGARLEHEIVKLAPLDASVLLTGETGTGKGRAARRLHELSARAGQPFVHVDCAALSGSLIESELFGHERGAFTGATQRYAGRFERAASGTLFLDEIGELAWELQSKLLRVLEDREYERVGGRETLRMRARVIAATSRQLFPADGYAAFRTDLYFRLSVFHLEIPPLRERIGELRALVAAGLARHGDPRKRPTPIASDGFIERLATHTWPGNVRELFNAIERAVARGAGPLLRAEDAEDALRAGARPSPAARRIGHVTPGLRQTLAAIERDEIAAALERSGGNIARAARALGLPRGTLRHKLRKHGLRSDGADRAAPRRNPGSGS